MSNILELNRQARRDPIKTGGILINPEDARPDMRHRIHTDPNSSRTFVILKPANNTSRGSSEFFTREFEYEFTRPTAARKDPIKTGGILINAEDAIPSMRHLIHSDSNLRSSYVLLKPASAPTSRKTSYEFDRPVTQRDPVKTGGILIKPEDARESMRHTIHVDPRSHATFVILKPWNQVHREQGSSSGAALEGRRSFEYEFIRREPVRKDPVKTGGVLVRPEDALPSMRHSLHVNPKTNSTYALLKPHRERGTRGNVDTRGSLDDLNSHIDSVITRSRNILSQSYVEGMPSLGYLADGTYA